MHDKLTRAYLEARRRSELQPQSREADVYDAIFDRLAQLPVDKEMHFDSAAKWGQRSGVQRHRFRAEREVPTLTDALDVLQGPSQEHTPEQRVAAIEVLRTLKSRTRAFPKSEREALDDAFRGLTVTAAARARNANPSAICMARSRAMSRLRDVFPEKGPGEVEVGFLQDLAVVLQAGLWDEL